MWSPALGLFVGLAILVAAVGLALHGLGAGFDLGNLEQWLGR